MLSLIAIGLLLFVEQKSKKVDPLDCTPPDYIMPGSKERPLLPLHPAVKDFKVRNLFFLSFFSFFFLQLQIHHCLCLNAVN